MSERRFDGKFVTTAYLDEAERANRVGFMHQGKLIRCDTPTALKHGLEERVYLVKAQDPRKTREILEKQPGVLMMQPSGADLHLFLNESITSPEKLAAITPFEAHPVSPSLEDVFIALMRKEEVAHAA